jgi:iron complex transport system permease protein
MTGLRISQESDHRITSLFILIVLAALLFIFFLADLITGPVKIPANHIFRILFLSDIDKTVWNAILFDFRIPKAITAMMAGTALAVSGLQMQTVFRNPLAGPDVLGVSSGASLGVALTVMGFRNLFTIHGLSYLSSWLQIIAASIGAAAILFLVLFVSLRVRDIMTILILGILFGSAASALVSVLQYFSHQSELKAFVIWSMGSLGSLSRSQLNVLMISLLAGLLMTLLTVKKLNALLLGETYARSMGVNIKITRILIFVSTSILSGSITAFCGPLAFVGIAVPHLARMLFKTADHRILLSGCLLLGSLLMLLADLISQIPGSDSVLPINSVTALLGIPVVIWVIISNRKLVSVGQ